MGRAPCCDKANVKKGPWSSEEDAKLKAYIEEHGTGGNWIALPIKIGLKRCGKSCRLRWLNYLRPNIKHGGFSEEEDNIICSLYISIGSRWSIIAAQLQGRTDNDIKNYWNTRLKKKLLGRRKESQAHRISTLSQEPRDVANNQNNSATLQALERMQLHMQIQGLSNHSSFYNNPALWPKFHPLGDRFLQNQHGDMIPAMPVQQVLTTAPTEPSQKAIFPGNGQFVNHGQFDDSSLNGFSSPSNSTAALQGELSDMLFGQNCCFGGQEDNPETLMGCFREMAGEKGNMIWWSNDGFEEKSWSSSWGSGSAIPPESILQECILEYDL